MTNLEVTAFHDIVEELAFLLEVLGRLDVKSNPVSLPNVAACELVIVSANEPNDKR